MVRILNTLLNEVELMMRFALMPLCHSRHVNFDEFSHCRLKKGNADFSGFLNNVCEAQLSTLKKKP